MSFPYESELRATRTLHGFIDLWRRVDPKAEACVDEHRRLSYGQLAERIDLIASAMLARGLRKGDRVATLAPPACDFLECFLATVSIGAIWVGLNPKYTRRELEHVLREVEPKLVLARREVRGRSYVEDFAALRSGFSFPMEVLIGADGAADPLIAGSASIDVAALDRARADVGPECDALIIFTSGSTGEPKGAVLRHGGLAYTSVEQTLLLGLQRPRVLDNLPINHIGCVGDLAMYAIAGGGAVVFQESFQPDTMLDVIRRERVSFWGQIPTMFQLTLERADIEAMRLPSLEMIMWSGAPAAPALIRQLRRLAPHVSNSYSSTETVGAITWCIDADDHTMATTIGYAHSAYQVRIATPEGAPVARGEAGEIQVKGDFVMRGYWNREEATREAFTADGWLKTGDLAVARPDGAYMLVGRLKEMYKSGGYNVYPREIEEVIEGIAGVEATVVVAVPDELYGEVGHAYVWLKGDARVLEDVEQACRLELANYKRPKRFFAVDEFPMLPNGKIDKAALRKRSMQVAPQP
jgi:acyl-CoA synthetase (AMP-forming)/AMP-acid ligase II